MIPWPEKCNACACRRCEKVLKCDVGDESKLHPCDACVDKPYLTEGCTLETAEGIATPKEVVEAFNRICTSLPHIKKLTDNRRKKIRARGATIEEFETVFTMAQESDFLTGKTGKWKAHFDWLMEPRNWQKVLEGTYPNQAPTQAKTRESLDYPQRKYSDAEVAHIFENLDSEEI